MISVRLTGFPIRLVEFTGRLPGFSVAAFVFPVTATVFFCTVFVGLELVEVFQEEVDVVQPVHEAILLVAVDVEVFTAARGGVRDGLCGQVDDDFGLGIRLDGSKELGEERFAHHDGQDEIVQLIILVNVGKEAAHDDSETVTGYRPCRVFAA